MDENITKGLFIRSLAGIEVPMNALLEDKKTLGSIISEYLESGVRYSWFLLIPVLLVLSILFFIQGQLLKRTLFWYVFGFGAGMVLAEWGVPGFDMIFLQILAVLIVFLLSATYLKQTPFKSSWFLIVGLYSGLLGLAFNTDLEATGLTRVERVYALFSFVLGLLVMQALYAGALWLFFKNFLKTAQKKYLAYLAGSLSVTIILLLFFAYVLPGETEIPGFEKKKGAAYYTLLTSQQNQTRGSNVVGVRQLSTPIMAYFTIESHEIRQEILVNARTAVQLLGVNDQGMGSIPVGSLELVKSQIIPVFSKNNPLYINGILSEPIESHADFVTLSAAGVLLRDNSVAESLDEGIIGISLVYETEKLADSMLINWQVFYEKLPAVEASLAGPFGSSIHYLMPGNSRLTWKNAMIGYKAPEIYDIHVELLKLPYLSYTLVLVVVVFLIINYKNGNERKLYKYLPHTILLAFIMFPFARFHLNLPGISQIKPSEEKTGTILQSLLTNVYRSFDVRNESVVYDRLERSVTGEKLTEIYLENRKSLEFENRGGARAIVDDVELKKIHKIRYAAKNTFTADIEWLVSGSVSHFGHTHYRRNHYHALITFTVVNDSWKIQDIKLIDEKRII